MMSLQDDGAKIVIINSALSVEAQYELFKQYANTETTIKIRLTIKGQPTEYFSTITPATQQAWIEQYELFNKDM